MSQVWFTADTHFGHSNIIKYCNRPFLSKEERDQAASDPRGRWRVSKETIERHDNVLINNINSCVSKDDRIWFLGDFCWGKRDEAKSYLDRIVCKNVNFVWGNHDHASIGSLFQKSIQQGMIKVEGQKIWLNHYPMRSWDGKFHGAWHLYGHVHGRLTQADNDNPAQLTRDAGVDVSDYRPLSFRDLAAYMKPRIVEFEAAKNRFVSGNPLTHDNVD